MAANYGSARPSPANLYEVDYVPQGIAANIGIAREVGGSVLIACRDGLSTALEELTPTQYEILVCTASSMNFASMSSKFKLTKNRLGDSIQEVRDTLGVCTNEQAATFIPIRENRLRELQLYSLHVNGNWDLNLARTQVEIFEHISDGMSTSQIAQQMDVSNAAVSSRKLTLSERIGTKDRTELQRVAGASKNLQRYAAEVEITVQRLRPQVQKILSHLETLERGGKLKLASPAVGKISNPKILQKLSDGEYIDKKSADSGKVPLVGFIAGLLMRRAESMDALEDPLTQTTARTVIQKEVQRHLADR